MSDIKRQPGNFNLLAKVNDKIILHRTKLTPQEALDIFFNKIEDNIKNTTYTAEELYDKYKEKWNKVNFKSTYIDSYGHTWPNTFVQNRKVFDYLNNLIEKLRQ